MAIWIIRTRLCNIDSLAGQVIHDCLALAILARGQLARAVLAARRENRAGDEPRYGLIPLLSGSYLLPPVVNPDWSSGEAGGELFDVPRRACDFRPVLRSVAAGGARPTPARSSRTATGSAVAAIAGIAAAGASGFRYGIGVQRPAA
jgi:hypothetical protein